MLGQAELVEEVTTGASKIVKMTGVANPGKTISILVRGVNKLVLDEADRSIHDALCVIRCLVKERALIAGGGAPEIELAIRLTEHANTLTGMEQYCFRAYADALELIPYTLAENAGLNPIVTVTELRNKHSQGEHTAGINVRKGAITNILDENVVQPLLVSTSAIQLATETVRSILKIDDIVSFLYFYLLTFVFVFITIFLLNSRSTPLKRAFKWREHQLKKKNNTKPYQYLFI